MTRDPEIVIVAAVAANGVIGRDGTLPWHLPADLKHFKRLTTGHPVIVGRRSFESIVDRLGEPLPDRVSIVLTRNDRSLPDDAVRAASLDAAIEAARALRDHDAIDASVVYVIGGASVYEAFLPLADRMILTELDETYEGDTRFPEWYPDKWTEVDREEREGFAFVTYERTR